MTRHWSPPDPASLPKEAGLDSRTGRFELSFNRHGDVTRIGNQFVSYPFHFTRPFALDGDIPALLTAYQQSSSGGLYRGDVLRTRLTIGAQAAAHVTTQAASVVHDCQGRAATQEALIDVGPDAFIAYTPDPLVLFPGASIDTHIAVDMHRDAVVLLQDAFAWHDPSEKGRRFDRIESGVNVHTPDGRLLVRERFSITGDGLATAFSGSRNWQTVSNFLLLGPEDRLPDREHLRRELETEDALAGISALPASMGWCVRCLSTNARAAHRVASTLFRSAVMARFGTPPAPRRK